MFQKISAAIHKQANPERAKFVQIFFKTGPGQYAEGDIFLGISVPECRAIAKQFSDLPLSDINKLLKSKYHEERLIALLLLINNYQISDSQKQKTIVELYLKSTKYINNWDLVDLSAAKILGQYLQNKKRKILYQLTKSKQLWEQRIAIVATYHFIKQNDHKDTLKISTILLNHKHDLMHKAVGWMLREVGKQDLPSLQKFLKTHYKIMPRTMLRYSIEKFPKSIRQKYLKGQI